jgi:tetratricopeptide (TPR) repeat protein
MKDPYEILGVSSDAPVSDIKRAYRDLAKKYHPDVSKSGDASRRMQEINEAYAVIGNPIKRAEYDQMQEMRAAQAPHPQHDASTHICCGRCGKVDSSLRVSTFTTVWSFFFFSFYRSWAYILCARCRVITSLRFNLQVLIFGWWGIPWGPLWSIIFLCKNGAGGHQPQDNNAILLAVVGQNLINLGDYAEAEKALTASLRLREDPAVIHLLQIAKSKSGYIRPQPFTKRLFKLESHPVIYNTILVLIFCGAIAGLIAAGDASDRRAAAANSTEKANNLPEITWWQGVQGKINLWRGDRWQIPIHIGDSYEDAVTKLGEPSEDWLHHFETTPGDEILAAQYKEANSNEYDWSDKGVHANFKNGKVESIVLGAKHYYYDFAGKSVYALAPDDKLEDFFCKLGKPQSTSPGDSHDVPETIDYTWWTPSYEIKASFANKTFDDGKKGQVNPGETFGGIFVADIKPLQDAATKLKNEQEKVALSGKTLTDKEIFEKYQERVVVVMCMNSRGIPYAQGTGFIYKGNEVLTNYHVVKDARTITIGNKFHETTVQMTPRWASEKTDCVMLQPDLGKVGWNDDDFPPVPVQTSIDPGEQVTVIGTPEGLPLSISTGIFSAQRNENGVDWLQITAPISHGSSGSPVFDSKAELIGLATLMLTDAQGLNFATPISTATKMEELEAKKGSFDEIREALGIAPNEKTVTWNPFGLGVLNKMPSPFDPGSPIWQQGEQDDPQFRAGNGLSDTARIKIYQAEIAADNANLSQYPDPEDQYALLKDIASSYDVLAAYYEQEQNPDSQNQALQTELTYLQRVVDDYSPEATFDEYFQIASLLQSQQPSLADTYFNKAIEWSNNQIAVLEPKLDKQLSASLTFEHAATAGELTTQATNIAKAEIKLGQILKAREWLVKASEWVKLSDWNPEYIGRTDIVRLLQICDQTQSSPVQPPLAPSTSTSLPDSGNTSSNATPAPPNVVVITDPPGAVIRNGHTIIGKAPVSLSDLSPGVLHLSADLPPYTIQRFDLTVPDSGNVQKKIILQKDKDFIAACGIPMVWIPDGNFWAEKYEVRQSEFEMVAGYNPSFFPRSSRPVETVSWEDAITFCNKLTQDERKAGTLPTGYQYTLPTESQWAEFSADADINQAAMSRTVLLTSTQDAGASEPNKYGLYDTLGNVWELCLDAFDDKGNHSLRGGSWLSSAENFPDRSTREAIPPKYKDKFTGFRVVLVGVSAPSEVPQSISPKNASTITVTLPDVDLAGPGTDFKSYSGPDATVTSPDHKVLVEQYSKDLGDQGTVHQFWTFDQDHQHPFLLNPGEGVDLAGYLAGFRFSPDSQSLVRMQKLGAGYGTLFLYRRNGYQFEPATKKPLGDLAWDYFFSLPVSKGMYRDPKDRYSPDHAEAILVKGLEENYGWMGEHWPDSRYIVISLSFDTQGEKPSSWIEGWHCVYDLKSGAFSMPPDFAGNNTKAVKTPKDSPGQ